MSKSKTRQELANEFGLSRSTFYRLMKRYEIEFPTGLVSPLNQKKVYDKLGNPAKSK